MSLGEPPDQMVGHRPTGERTPLHDCVEVVPDAMVALDGDGRIVFTNGHLDAMFGYSPGELVGQFIERLVPNRHGAAHQHHVRTYLQAPNPRPMGLGSRFVGLRSDGQEFQVEVSLGPVKASDAIVAVAVVRDASARDAAENKVLQNEQLLTSLVNGIADHAVFLLDPEGRILTWNPGAEAIKGYRADEIVGQQYSVFFSPEDQTAGAPEQILATARREGRFEGEGWRVRKDGSRFLAHATIDAIHDASAGVTGFAKLTRDITSAREADRLAREAESQLIIARERERAAASLEMTSRTLNAIIEASPLGIGVINKDGLAEMWNPACERIFGHSAAEVIGLDRAALSRLLAVEWREDSSRPWPSREETLGIVHEARRRRKDGGLIDVRLSHALIREAGEEPIGDLYVIEDITERKLVEQQLLQAQKMEAMGQLTGGFAHDFNNLLSIVICNLDFLIEDIEDNSSSRECALMALDASLRGAELIKQMLSFSRKQRLESLVVDVNKLVVGMTNMINSSLGEHIKVTLKNEPDLWPSLLDPTQLQTALLNLATNARDAMPDGGELLIETANSVLDEDYVRLFPDVPAGDYVMIAVSDTGRGMSAEVASRVFEPFFTTKGESKGTGLGLSMVFGFIKQSAGHIRIYSEPGFGATIRLYLPRAMVGVAEPPATGRSRGSRANDETILVVEDRIDLAISVEAVLRRAGFSPIVVYDAKSAMEIIGGDTPIDLLFTDIILGSGMNGMDLATEATARRPGLKILFTSGFAETALTGHGKTAVTDRIISKPYRSEDLLEKIAEVLG
jgi:PAS domain S-box-containing protein